MANIFWDIETYSELDLLSCGTFNYARHPSTDVIYLCFAVDDNAVEVWRPGDPVPAPFATPAEHMFISDNWTFENSILEFILIPRYRFVPIPFQNQDCAQRKALASAFPAELGLGCEALGLPYRKDKAARDAMRRVTRPSKRKRKKPEDPAARERDLALLLERCKSDVAMTRACYNHPRLRPLPPTERQVLLVDAKINMRGICANTLFLEAADALAKKELIKINAHINVLTNGAVKTINQCRLIQKLVNARKHNMTTLSKRAVAAVLAHQPDPFTREILTLRQRGGFASTLKFAKLLNYASPDDRRLRHGLRYHGAGPGRWTSPGAQLQNLPRNDAELPASLVDAVLAGNSAELERYGDLLKILSQLSRASLCAAPGHELLCVDLSAIESRGTAWLSGEKWKLDNFKRYDETGNKALDLYRVLAHFILKKNSPVENISAAERQLGKYAELAFNFGGATGAWKKIVGNDGRSDAEIMAIVQAWRSKHPVTRMFWRRLLTAARTAIHDKRPVEVNPPPLPPITANFDGYALTLKLPSNRVINYPGARLVPNEKFEDAPLDIVFFDNEKKKWKLKRAWHGLLVENVVQGTCRDLLADAIMRAEARGWKVVHHNHDELIIEAPIGAISAQDALALLLEPPAWAVGLPLGGKVRVGPLFLEAPATGEPTSAPATIDYVENVDDAESAIDVEDIADVENTESVAEDANENIPSDDVVLTCLDEMHTETGSHTELVGELPDDRERASREAANKTLPWEGIASFTAPLKTENKPNDGFAGYTSDIEGFAREKIHCPFHDDRTPSCQLYSDGHYHCFGCGQHGWINEDMDLPDDVVDRILITKDTSHTLERGLELWDEAKPIAFTLAARYLANTRNLDLATLPSNIDEILRFHSNCPFSDNGARLPCLLALFRDVMSDARAGIHRIGLTSDAQKIKRLTMGRWPGARAIKLWPVAHTLAIGEGIETVLGAIRVSAIAPPSWPLCSRTNIAKFPVLPGVEELTILVDNDSKDAQKRADTEACARACAERWFASGRSVQFLRTTRVKDFNDLVLS